MLIVYRGGVDWQETTALAITAATVGAFVWARWRRRKFRFQRDTHCGCASANQSTPGQRFDCVPCPQRRATPDHHEGALTGLLAHSFIAKLPTPVPMSKLSSIVSDTEKAAATRTRRRSESRWVPHTDAYVNEGGLVIKVELAGLRREDLELTVDGNALAHRRRTRRRLPYGQLHVSGDGINYGAFETVIEVPEGFDLTRAKESYLNGFLRVDVPVADNSARARSPAVGQHQARLSA